MEHGIEGLIMCGKVGEVDDESDLWNTRGAQLRGQHCTEGRCTAWIQCAVCGGPEGADRAQVDGLAGGVRPGEQHEPPRLAAERAVIGHEGRRATQRPRPNAEQWVPALERARTHAHTHVCVTYVVGAPAGCGGR